MIPSLSKFRRECIATRRFLTRLQFGLVLPICLFAILGSVAWAPAEAVQEQPARSAADSRPATPAKTSQLAKPAVPRSQSKSSSKSRPVQAQFSLREGTRIVDQTGYFRMTGDRVVFFSTQRNTRYMALENLNLERIVNAMANQPRQRKWKVTGMLTEFHGDNYLLVEKAVLESWGDAVRHSP